MQQLRVIKSEDDFNNVLKSNKYSVAHFWAQWCEPCSQLNNVLAILATKHQAAFMKVEAEETTELSIAYEVTVVPLILVFKGDTEVERLEGPDIPALKDRLNKLCIPLATDGEPKNELSSGQGSLDGEGRVNKIVNSEHIVLLMKGTPAAPKCGFSARVVKLLQQLDVPFKHFDVLLDEDIRRAAKVYASWPSYPQLYVAGHFIGGCDVVEEMHAAGELAAAFTVTELGMGNNSKCMPSLEEKLSTLTHSAEVVLFMKVVQALHSTGIAFKHFDILQDNEVREGLKKYSQWPTYPQLYAGGELVGGCDIIEELVQRGVLQESIESQIAMQNAAHVHNVQK